MNLNTKLAIVLLSFLAVFVILFILWHYVYNIYEVSYTVTPRNLYADGRSTIRIEALPVNAMGFKSLGRKVEAEFEITEGKELVDIISRNRQEGTMELKARDIPGTVVIQMKSKFVLMPTLIEIPVLSSTADNS